MPGADAMGASASRSLHRFACRPSAGQLVCFPFAGAGASLFADWQPELPTTDVVAVRLPGRESRLHEPRFRDLRAAAGAIANEISSLAAQGCSFFGHSMGALLAYEVCLELRRRGQRLPERLVVSARPAPQLPATSRLHQLSDEALLRVVERYGGTPAEVLGTDYFRRYFLGTIRDDFAMVERYRYVCEAPLDVPIVALAPESDPGVSRDSMARWRELTLAPFRLHCMRGGHFFIQEHPRRVTAILRNLADRS